MEAQSGIGIFKEQFFESYSWNTDGSLLFWFETITIIAALVFRIKKNMVRTEIFKKLTLLSGLWGTTYGLIITCVAISNPNL